MLTRLTTIYTKVAGDVPTSLPIGGTDILSVGPGGILPAECGAGETPAGPTGWKPVPPSGLHCDMPSSIGGVREQSICSCAGVARNFPCALPRNSR